MLAMICCYIEGKIKTYMDLLTMALHLTEKDPFYDLHRKVNLYNLGT